MDGGLSKIPGDIKFIDINGDGVVDQGKNTVDDPGDKRIIGNDRARYRYGFNITADWKGFDLGIFFQGVGKRDMVLPDNFKYQYSSEWQVPQGYANDYWTEDNRDALFPVPRFNGGTPLRNVNSTRYLVDASYLRLKSLTFGYTLPETWTQKAYIQKARIYFSAERKPVHHQAHAGRLRPGTGRPVQVSVATRLVDWCKPNILITHKN